jgi:anti-sigma-K factor RskA
MTRARKFSCSKPPEGMVKSELFERWKMSQLDARRRFDEYLDGSLDAASQRQLEATLAADPAEARLLARMKSERALRTVAYDSYMPSAAESRELTAQFMAAAYAPVGRVGIWSQTRRWASVAAAIAVLIGTFAAGRMTAGTSTTSIASAETKIYRVVYLDREGVRTVSGDLKEDEVKDYVAAIEKDGNTIVAADYADLIMAGNM